MAQVRPDLIEPILGTDTQPYHILVTGVTGYGKSTLVAGISGQTTSVSAGNSSTELVGVNTKEITPVQCVLGDNVTATLWDTPGLLSGAEDPEHLLKQIKRVRHDLVIHCMRCTDARLMSGSDNSGMLSVCILTEQFGAAFWTNAIFALTFANNLEGYRPTWTNMTTDEKESAFGNEVELWESFIRKNLTEYAKVPESIIKTVSVIPVGHYSAPVLIDGQNWIDNLKSLCNEALRLPRGASDVGDSDYSHRELTQARRSPRRLLCCRKRALSDDSDSN